MFNEALKLILKFEGGYANNPNDPGGATNFGITQAVYDPTRKKNVKDITMPEVESIYNNQYWLEGKSNLIEDINPSLSVIHFDCGVNCGIYRAASILQLILEVPIDGKIGPITLSKITSDPKLSEDYLDKRKDFYIKLINSNSKLLEFKSSWFHRLDSLAKYFNLNWHSVNES